MPRNIRLAFSRAPLVGVSSGVTIPNELYTSVIVSKAAGSVVDSLACVAAPVRPRLILDNANVLTAESQYVTSGALGSILLRTMPSLKFVVGSRTALIAASKLCMALAKMLEEKGFGIERDEPGGVQMHRFLRLEEWKSKAINEARLSDW